MLQLRETPLCTGADRAVIQNNLAGAAIQRADMCSVYQAGFVTEKKALVEFGERFIQGAAALVDRSRRMDGLSNLHVVSLNENVLFDHGFEKIKLKRVILT